MRGMRILKLLLILGFVLFTGYVFIYPWLIPLDGLKKENPRLTAMMKYRMKQWEREGKKVTIKQIWVPLKRISPYMIKAVLIGEDDKFYKHSGFDFEAMKKALEKNLEAGKIKYGGSTISQQTAKNLFLSPSRNPVRKLQEAILTYRLEKALSKKRILEIYLNIAEWGEGVFGVEAASRYYFHKPASALSPWEAARLAAVLPNPLKYNPLSNTSYVNYRSRLIYFIMKKRGIIKEEFEEIEKESEVKGQNEDIEAQTELPSEPPQGENPEPSKLEEEKRL